MARIANQVQNELKKSSKTNSYFYQDYKEFSKSYQKLLDKGVTSKRKSQLPSLADKMAMAASFSFSKGSGSIDIKFGRM
jgi:hypothetical protein